MVVSSKAQYRGPALTGDATILNGTVAGTRVDRRGRHLVQVEVRMTTQADTLLSTATAEVLLPSQAALDAGAVRDGQDLESVR